MITLITGTPGAGKTLYAVSKIIEYTKQNEKLLQEGKEPRTIYSDIDGLIIKGVEPAPDDWRDTPDGSIIFYDEIQQRNEFKKSRFENEVCDALQVHRHTGHDIYGITQFPVLLHPSFRAVVGVHLHLHRGWGLTAATVYQWAYCVDAPNAPSNKKLAEHTFRFNYPKDLYKYYKSATQHTHKARIPKRIFAGIAGILLMGYFAYNLLFKQNNFLTTLYGKEQTVKVQENPYQQTTLSVNTEQQQAEKIQNQQYETQLQTDIDKLNQEIQKIQLEQQLAQLKQQSQPANVISFGGKCKTYSQSGQHIPMPLDECMQYANGEKPLFKQSVDAQFMANNY